MSLVWGPRRSFECGPEPTVRAGRRERQDFRLGACEWCECRGRCAGGSAVTVLCVPGSRERAAGSAFSACEARSPLVPLRGGCLLQAAGPARPCPRRLLWGTRSATRWGHTRTWWEAIPDLVRSFPDPVGSFPDLVGSFPRRAGLPWVHSCSLVVQLISVGLGMTGHFF